ncbi:hypothetical protein [Acinetobacter sp. 'aerobic (ED)']|uniref:hypothetical protein n=1 Tax=Acinetobacter sp. 'aerobic (ED)' TaxID=174230 RepID=UPI00192AF19C|nr:hypothetical protein [Acinetobacter sp. 'aerobic (ED)']
MTTKYDWSNVPNNVLWLAKDSLGCVWGYENKPVPMSNHGGYYDTINVKSFRQFHLSLPNLHWKDSLEQRPGEPQ